MPIPPQIRSRLRASGFSGLGDAAADIYTPVTTSEAIFAPSDFKPPVASTTMQAEETLLDYAKTAPDANVAFQKSWNVVYAVGALVAAYFYFTSENHRR